MSSFQRAAGRDPRPGLRSEELGQIDAVFHFADRSSRPKKLLLLRRQWASGRMYVVAEHQRRAPRHRHMRWLSHHTDSSGMNRDLWPSVDGNSVEYRPRAAEQGNIRRFLVASPAAIGRRKAGGLRIRQITHAVSFVVESYAILVSPWRHSDAYSAYDRETVFY